MTSVRRRRKGDVRRLVTTLPCHRHDGGDARSEEVYVWTSLEVLGGREDVEAAVEPDEMGREEMEWDAEGGGVVRGCAAH